MLGWLDNFKIYKFKIQLTTSNYDALNEIYVWGEENNIKLSVGMYDIVGKTFIEAFRYTLKIRGKKNAVLFKLRWSEIIWAGPELKK